MGHRFIRIPLLYDSVPNMGSSTHFQFHYGGSEYSPPAILYPFNHREDITLATMFVRLDSIGNAINPQSTRFDFAEK